KLSVTTRNSVTTYAAGRRRRSASRTIDRFVPPPSSVSVRAGLAVAAPSVPEIRGMIRPRSHGYIRANPVCARRSQWLLLGAASILALEIAVPVARERDGEDVAVQGRVARLHRVLRRGIGAQHRADRGQ